VAFLLGIAHGLIINHLLDFNRFLDIDVVIRLRPDRIITGE